MSYRLVTKFVEMLDGHAITTITGAMSPLIVNAPWTRNVLAYLAINKGRETAMFFDEHTYLMLCEEMFKRCFEKQISIRELEEKYLSFASRVQSLHDEGVQIDFPNTDEKSILTFFREVMTAYEMIADTMYIEALDYNIALKVIGNERKSTLDAIWEKATHPTFVSFEGRWLSQILEHLKETDDLALVLPKVRYIYTDYYWTKDDAEIRTALTHIQSHLTEKGNELKTIEENARVAQSGYVAWKDSLKPQERFLVEYIQMIMRFRDARKDPIAQLQSLFVSMATELLKRAHINAECGRVVTVQECVRGVDYLKSIGDEVMKRVGGNISLVNLDSTVEMEQGDYDEAVEQFYAMTKKQVDAVDNMVRGQTANKGKVSGKVRVVLDPERYEGFMDGDILVTSMTRPEFVPIMKRAGAVVTNEGGITCHAAIVSRELGIPCIIGTKHATHILHDGDLVEVDAEKGIVRIIERK